MRSPAHCTSCCAFVGADAYIGPNRIFPAPRQGTRALPYKVLRYRARADRVVRPYNCFRRGGVLPRPREGKSPKRRRWRKKRGDFEEVPRLAATTVAGNRLAQRWAREPRPYAPSRTHCIGRTESSAPTSNSVGADAYIGPLTALLAMCHCETSDRCHWLWQSVTPAHRTSCKSNDTQIPSASVVPLRHCLPFCEKNFLKNKNL